MSDHHVSRQKPPQRSERTIADVAFVVVPTRAPWDARAFFADQETDARRYAKEHEAEVQPLPLTSD